MKILACNLLFLFALFSVTAYPSLSRYTANLDDQALADIAYEDDCHRSTEDGSGLIWIPEHPLGEKIRRQYDEMNPGLAVEIVSVIPLNHYSPGDLVLLVTNKFLGVSGQEGISYYSSTRKKNMTLIEKSFAVDKVGSRRKRNDPRFDRIPAELDAIVYQKDSSFGGNYFLYHSEIEEDASFLTMTNKTKMSVMGFFTVAEPDENIMSYIIIPCEDGIYIYTAVFVNDPPEQEKIFGISVNIEGFFLKRIRKIVEWFRVDFKGE
jgi:hypothetical protein